MRLSKPNAVPKPRPAALDRADRRKLRAKLDEAQNRIVRRRSGGRCEVLTPMKGLAFHVRCPYRAVHVHHMLSGIGVRGLGQSALAINKLHCCRTCHADIHAHVLVCDGAYFRRVL